MTTQDDDAKSFDGRSGTADTEVPTAGRGATVVSHEPDTDYAGYHAQLSAALLARRVEEKLLEMFDQGLLNGTVHTCIGQELIGACTAHYLVDGDFVVSNHRGHGHYLARIGDPQRLIAEIMGRITGACGGIGGSQHLWGENYLSNGIQGGMCPIAAGVALANSLRGSDRISVAFIGDGTLGEGIVWETLNLAAIWGVPVLFVVENNGYAQSTSMKQTFAGSLAKRVEGFGVAYAKTDCWSLRKLDTACRDAVARVRSGSGPMLLEVETYRLKSHSKGDDNRDELEVAHFRERDVLEAFAAAEEALHAEFLAAADARVSEAVAFAESSEPLSSIANVSAVFCEPVTWRAADPGTGERNHELIHASFARRFESDERYVLIGEDIEWTTDWTPKGYGGAFKISKDLSVRYPGRVRNTPISEAAITGIGTGLALGGMRPLVEIMFGDFLSLTFDQLQQHASKFRAMTAGRVEVPLVVRAPMGGRRGYGPTHSQSIEKYFLGIPGLEVFALNNRVHPGQLYDRIFDEVVDPALVIENKILYTRRFGSPDLRGFDISVTEESFPTLRIRPTGSAASVTVLCYGGVLEEVEQAIEDAFDEEEILCEVIAPTRLHPLNLTPILDSVRATQRLVVVEEGPDFGAFGSEVSAQLSERGVTLHSFSRVANRSIIPSSITAELELLPGRRTVLDAIIKALA